MMKVMSIACFLLMAAVALTSATDSAVEKTDDDFTAVEDLTESARFAFITVNSDGSVSFTFNATSLQYTLLAGALLLGLGLLLLPLLGLLGLIGKKGGDSYDGYEGGSGEYGYADPSAAYASAPTASTYGAAAAAAGPSYPSRNSYTGYAKRSLSWMAGPIMQALEKTYKKYEEDQQHQD